MRELILEPKPKKTTVKIKMKKPSPSERLVELRRERRARIAERVKKWEARASRAERALAKLRKQLRYYDHVLSPAGSGAGVTQASI